MLKQKLLTAEAILSKKFAGFVQVVSNHQQLPQIVDVFQEISFCRHCQFEQTCWLHLFCEPLTMFIELSNHSIWPNILAYKRLQNAHTHNNKSALFNRINHFHCLRFVAQKENFRMQAARVLKTTVLLFLAWINKNYCNSHLKNVKTIITVILNDRLQMTLITSENGIFEIHGQLRPSNYL